VERIKLFLLYGYKLVIALLLFIIPFAFQLMYWKTYSGQWFIFTYGTGERFFFNDPQVINFLFSFRKGWFIYTPVMFLAVIGIAFLRKYVKDLFWFMVLFFIMNVYVLSSWWDWSFGGSFGCRAIVQHYSFFAFGLASFVNVVFRLWERKKALNTTVKLVLCIGLFFLIRLNYNQSWLYKYSIIHPSGMTKDAYMYIMSRDSFGTEEVRTIQKLLKIPNDKEMLKGKRS
jgi:hypothetical protein